jgi:hypothetical protein
MPNRISIKLLVILLFPFQLFAQDVTGLWKGFMYNDTTQLNYRYEIAISQEKGKLFGYSHTYFIVGDKEYHGVKKLKITKDGDEITTEDVDLIANNYPVSPPKGIHMQNILKFQMKDTVMILSGMFRTNRTRIFSPNTGYIHVERKKDYSQSALVPHLQELGLAKNLTFLKEEAPTLTQTEFVLKPVTTDEEVKALVVAAQKKQQTSKIKTSVTPDVKIPEVAAIKEPEVQREIIIPQKETKPPVNVAVQQKPVEPPVVKNTLPKKQEQPVTAPPVKKQEPVVVTKTIEPPIVKTIVPPTPVTKPVVPKQQPVIIDPTAATDLAKRKIETIQALYFKSDSLTLTLYDNGEVDGDTVSVIMNGTVFMPKVGLSTNAVKKTIYTNEIAGDSIQLVMYAESLGSLPPNTGLLIVYDGNDRYEIRFSGDMQKSSAIVFRRRKE